MNRTLLPKEGIVAFSCGLARKYIDDRMAQQRSWDSQKGLRMCFLLSKFFRPILYKYPGLWCNGGCGNKDLTSVLAEDQPC